MYSKMYGLIVFVRGKRLNLCFVDKSMNMCKVENVCVCVCVYMYICMSVYMCECV